MQEFSMYSQIQPQFPEQEQLKCPRCDSTNTKFCYYNNYNLSQPRHFCKNCKRYWTKGGTLRNIPVGGGSRKRSSPSSTATAASKRPAAESAPPKDKKTNVAKNTGENLPQKGENFGGQFDNLSFSTLLGSNSDQYVGLLDGLGPNGSNLRVNEHFSDVGSDRNVNLGLEVGDGDGFLNMGGDAGDDGCWEAAGGNQWPGLAIFTPGSNFQ